jgi:hypothetical protein
MCVEISTLAEGFIAQTTFERLNAIVNAAKMQFQSFLSVKESFT